MGATAFLFDFTIYLSAYSPPCTPLLPLLPVRRVSLPAWDSDDASAPQLHLILVTHDHIDSFDKVAVKQLLTWSGPTFCAGRGMAGICRVYNDVY